MSGTELSFIKESLTLFALSFWNGVILIDCRELQLLLITSIFHGLVVMVY